MRSGMGCIASALFIAIAAVASSASVANAGATVSGGKAAGCGISPVAALSQAGAAATSAPSSVRATGTVAGYKAAHEAEAAGWPASSAANVAQEEEKNALIKSGQLKARTTVAKQTRCTGMPDRSTPNSSNTVIPYLAQFGQAKGWYCGPATVSEFSATVPGPSPYNLDQGTVAAYMGTTQQYGTDAPSEVRGLNHFVGIPDFGGNYYLSVGMHDPPTAVERGNFEHNLDTDISQRSPVAGDAWEVPYGPHLVGHPVNQEIKHWFEIGGRAGSRSYYADSATTVWSGVPPYSWYDTYTLETILGGFGYIW